MQKKSYDVVVVGGGPAGSSTAAFLAQHGREVLLLERELFPRPHVGESLMPATYWQFERLGILEKLKSTSFVRKHSVQFISQSGKESRPFYFSETNSHESAVTWQVQRASFDNLLLQTAQDLGADVLQETSVKDVLFEDDKAVGVLAKTKDGKTHCISAKVVVDASGGNRLLSKKLKIRQPDPILRKMSIYTSFEGGHRDEGIDEGATLIIQTKEKKAWFWYIPLNNNKVSVGLVSDRDVLFGKDKDPQKIFEREVEQCTAVKKRLASAKQSEPVVTCKDFSYFSEKPVGDGYVMVGDAFAFIDPVYSSGVFLALKSGELAADSIHEALLVDDLSAEKLGGFVPTLQAGMEPLKKLVYTFYDHEFSFAGFLKENPQYKQNLIDLLTGDVFKEGVGAIFDAIEEYKRANGHSQGQRVSS